MTKFLNFMSWLSSKLPHLSDFDDHQEGLFDDPSWEIDDRESVLS